MRKNLLLIAGIGFALILGVSSARRISTLHNTSQKVVSAQERLEKLRSENTRLKQELEYKKTEEFKEAEIRDKLGLVKEGEAIVIIPKNENERITDNDAEDEMPNWDKWRILFFGEL